MDCDTCKKERAQEAGAVPRWTHEADMARMERTVIKLWILLIIMLALLFGTNAGWVWYEAQFVEEVTETVETSTDGGGNAYGAIVSGDNSEVHYGENQGDTD